MSRMKLMVGSCFAVVFALLAWGCAGTARNATAPVNASTGQHPAAWIQNHWAEYVKSPDQCRACHGSTADPAAAGGISKVSCFSCHTNGVNHPAGWADPAQHGRAAKLAPSTNPTAMAGFAHCAKCHGTTFSDGLAISCKTCHTKAPHPGMPWHGTTASLTNHITTNISNAPECYKCHAGGANSTIKPVTPAPAGTAPGCTNATMCHGRDF